METFPENPGGRRRAALDGAVALVAAATLAFGPLWTAFGRAPDVAGDAGPPRFTVGAFLDGSWTRAFEDWLELLAPPAVLLRAQGRAVLYVTGVRGLENDSVYQPVPGHALNRSLRGRLAVDRLATSHEEFLAEGARRADRLGVRLLLAAAPSQRRTIPSIVDPAHPAPDPDMVDLHDRLAALCDRHGIVWVDQDAEVERMRARTPAARLYPHGDGHWDMTLASVAARRIAAELDLEPADAGGRHPPFAWIHDRPGPQDAIEGLLGLNAGSFLGPWLHWRRDAVVGSPADGAAGSAGGQDRGRTVAVAGDSFAPPVARLLRSLLPVHVDDGSVQKASRPPVRLAHVLGRIERGELEARTVVLVTSENAFTRPTRVPEAWR